MSDATDSIKESAVRVADVTPPNTVSAREATSQSRERVALSLLLRPDRHEP